ncbi:uncharacterized protein LOC115760736 [Drosophila novamexicana]|uniref:uncharacterized protein LOC115760736 n=1 Tax=Drosophila novamexicana TaxID=47314 RepID=UPI0011E58ABD|nr:uncharacterized protein LOC115760736 [Drosophila novamexicana]
MSRMTHLLLLAAIIGSLQMPAHAAGETSPDYENVYDDDDASRSPGNLAKSTATPMVPYFDQKTAVIYVQPNATNVKLDCPVKNYDAIHHAILWYRDKQLVVNGNQSIINIYSLDNQFVLNVPLANATGHKFECNVIPANVSRQITIKLGLPPTSPPPSSAPNLRWPAAVNCIILSALPLIYRSASARF